MEFAAPQHVRLLDVIVNWYSAASDARESNGDNTRVNVDLPGCQLTGNDKNERSVDLSFSWVQNFTT